MTGPTAAARRWALEERRLYLCTPDRSDLASFVDACIRGGVDLVQLREKHLGDAELVARATIAMKVCADHGVPFILNDRPDLAAAVGADGVHVGQEDGPVSAARQAVGDGALVGLSTHSPDELAQAIEDGAHVDYISAGPVVATPTKPGRPGTGLGYVTHAVSRSPWPVWVTGGADPTSAGAIVAAGGRHLVAVRWLTEAEDPERHARLLRHAIEAAIEAAASAVAATELG